MIRIDCFLPFASKEQIAQTLEQLTASSLVGKIFLLATEETEGFGGYEVLHIDSLKSSATMHLIASKATSDYIFVYQKYSPLQLGYFALDRMVNLADDSAAGMGLAMQAAAENGKEFVVLDRPNPLGGLKIEGNLTEDKFISFVSQFKIPYLYGLTCGELANLLNNEQMLGKKCKLTVIPMA